MSHREEAQAEKTQDTLERLCLSAGLGMNASWGPPSEMAQQENQRDQKKFCCSICLDLLKDPVTIPCGHSYCMNCIKTHWDDEDEKKIHSCPQCRQTFTPRPVLSEKHHPHYDAPPLKKHKLVDPSKKLQENICSRHDEVMKMFCRTDQKCICYLCSVEEHKDHDTVSAAAERTERQRELEVSRQNIQQRIQDREKDVKELQQEVEAINRSADKAVEDSEKIFSQLIRLIQKRSSDVKQQLRSQQETEVLRSSRVGVYLDHRAGLSGMRCMPCKSISCREKPSSGDVVHLRGASVPELRWSSRGGGLSGLHLQDYTVTEGKCA
ncbi:hypothetical protein L3Q82_006037 [Scortum barcoo]|uniref:Uncharacterized protein n=1 Tax=Scortum barcoo TaxID=214431 RepID=A0ACB8X265_9TELE|nr:hypothetical protein L3Q82_006037 [Scortum barcoo]